MPAWRELSGAGIVVHIYNPSTWKAGRSGVQGQPRLVSKSEPAWATLYLVSKRKGKKNLKLDNWWRQKKISSQFWRLSSPKARPWCYVWGMLSCRPLRQKTSNIPTATEIQIQPFIQINSLVNNSDQPMRWNPTTQTSPISSISQHHCRRSSFHTSSLEYELKH